jgi:hypothetical protein
MGLRGEEAGGGCLGAYSGVFGGFWLVYQGVLAAACVSGVGLWGC